VKKKVLILGKTGMLGHMVERVLAETGAVDVHGTHITDQHDPFYFNVMTGLPELAKICDRSTNYDYFINCIGMVTGQINNNDIAAVRRAIKINAVFPHELASFAEKRGTKVIHISTDGVFSGKADSYLEDDSHDCNDLYGTTKSLGEVFNECFLNLRCSIIGPSPFEKRGLLEWFLQQSSGAVLSGYTNHIWHGISTYQFAKLCLKIIEGDRFEEIRRESAVFHFAPNEPVTKHDLLCLFNKYFQKQAEIGEAASDQNIRRVLQTKYHGLKNIYPHDISADEMVSELANYMNKDSSRR